MSEIKNTDRLYTQLVAIHRALLNISKASVLSIDIVKTLALIGLALLIRNEECKIRAEDQQLCLITRILEEGRTGILNVMTDILQSKNSLRLPCAKASIDLLQEELIRHGDERLRMVLKKVEVLDLSSNSLGSDRMLGQAFRLLLDNELHQDGMVNDSVNDLMINLATHYGPVKRLSDPFFGFGILAFGVADQMAMVFQEQSAVEGQEIIQDRWLLANLLAAMYGQSYRIEIGDTLWDPRLLNPRGLEQYDLIVTDLPNGLTIKEMGSPDRFERFQEVSNAFEWMALQHLLATLSPKGRAVVLTTPSTLFSRGTGTRIRKRWIEEDCLEAVITLPAGLWHPVTNIPPVVLVFNRDKPSNRSKRVVFLKIEGPQYFDTIPRSRGRRLLSKKGIESVLDLVFSRNITQINHEGIRYGVEMFITNRDLILIENDEFDLTPESRISASLLEDQEQFQNLTSRASREELEYRVGASVESQRSAETRLDNLLIQFFNSHPSKMYEESKQFPIEIDTIPEDEGNSPEIERWLDENYQ